MEPPEPTQTTKLPRPLDPVEIRLLGCLLEKEQATPEYYPLTLKALIAACSQRSNREPVMELEESAVVAALDRLHAEVMVWPVSGGRAERWRHALDRWQLDPPARAVMTLLLLRGPQTAGELRGRSERLHQFTSTAEVEAALRSLASGPEPLAVLLPRRPGQKEPRWMHLAGGEPEQGPALVATPTPRPPGLADRIEVLEARVAHLEAELERLRQALGED